MKHLLKVTGLLCILLIGPGIISHAKEFKVISPDKKIVITIIAEKDIKWSVTYGGEILLLPSRLTMELSDGKILGIDPKVKKAVPSSYSALIKAEIPVKNSIIPEVYNQLILRFSESFSVVFRAYNDGVAYRFVTSYPQQEIIVKNETADFNFPDNFHTAWPSTGFGFMGMPPMMGSQVKNPGFGSRNPVMIGMKDFPAPPPGMVPGVPPPGNQAGKGMPGMGTSNAFETSYEYVFLDSTIAAIEETAGLPLYLSTAKGTKMILAEADLADYPNMFISGTKSNTLRATFPLAVIKETNSKFPFGAKNETADYIALTTGSRAYPWRVIIISPNDKGLLENDLIYKLSRAPVIKADWVKPGQVTWEWYNGTNLFGVDFESGINTATYKYYIDFAAKYGIEYLLIDAGWSDNPNVNIPEIVVYANKKGVDVILWIAWTDMKTDTEKTLDQYQQWGVKGVKMDYMNRADQQMVNFYEKVAMETAKRKMILDLHGAYKPSGLNRKYPNVVNFESVMGMEINKMGSSDVTPSHDIVLLFTRMVTGPMDYTPGAMVTAAYGNFKNISTEPMSQGTRAHQAAMYVMFDAPLQMLADNPSLYMREEEVIRFLTRIPTVWDKTIGIDGKIGQYAIMARKKEDNWYIGAMTDWSKRSFDITFDFLDDRLYNIDIFSDGVNASKKGIDYKITSGQVKANDKISFTMEQGGGWVAILTPVK